MCARTASGSFTSTRTHSSRGRRFWHTTTSQSTPVVSPSRRRRRRAADALARYPHRLGGTQRTTGPPGSMSRQHRARADRGAHRAAARWDEVILQGPHIGICNPFAKQPRPTGRHHRTTRLGTSSTLPDSVIPRTNWQRVASRAGRSKRRSRRGTGSRHTERYRVDRARQVPSNTARPSSARCSRPGHRRRASATSARLATDERLCAFTGMLGGLLSDFLVRMHSGAGDLHDNVIATFPMPEPDTLICTRSSIARCASTA